MARQTSFCMKKVTSFRASANAV